MISLTRILFLFVLIFAVLGFANAQAGLGSLAGTVTDPQHALVNGATVTLSNPSTGFSATAKTINGEFRFFALEVAPGYVLKITAPGFKNYEAKNISTSVGTVLGMNITLQVGAQTETVEVIGSLNVEQVQTETSSVSQLIDSEVWKTAPLEERTSNAFVGLVAGATPDSGTGRGFSVDGARTGTGNFLVEGMDNNDQGLGGASAVGGGGSITTISPDAIQEYRVIAHNAPAEYGRAGGFSTDTVLKSGTNQWHGSLFEYNRIQALADRNWFPKLNGVTEHLVRNQFGGSIGGRIYKDKTYFYATVELHRRVESTPIQGYTTTQAFLNFVDSGQFETFNESDTGTLSSTGGVCWYAFSTTCSGALLHAAHLGSVFKALYGAEKSQFPLSTLNETYTSGGFFFGGVKYPVPIFAFNPTVANDRLSQNRGSMKIDHKFSDRDQFSTAYLADLYEDDVSNEGGNSAFGPAGGNIGGAQNFSMTWTHTFSPSLLNILRAGYLRHVSNFDTIIPLSSMIPNIFTAFDELNEGFGAANNLPQYFTENEFLYQDSITKTLPKHVFKGGFQFIRTRNGSSFPADFTGTLAPYDTENLLTDAMANDDLENYFFGGSVYGSLYEATAAINPTNMLLPDPYRGYRANEFSAYIQDDWKPTPRLTLNIGVRWDYFGPPHNFKSGIDSNVYFGAFGTPTPTGNPFEPQTPFAGAVQGAQFLQKNSNIWNKDTTSIGPHLGFSYDPRGDAKLAIRGGFSIGYDRLYNNVYENIRFNAPLYADNAEGYYMNGVPIGGLNNPGVYASPFTGNVLLAESGALPVPRHIDQRLKNASYMQANLGFEYQIKPGYVFEMDYVGTFGRDLVGLLNINTFPGRTACPIGTYAPTSACYLAGYPNGFSTHRLNTTAFNNDNFRTNAYSSNYNGLQLSFRKGFANGIQFAANYTYSKALDQVSDVFTQRNGSLGAQNSWNVNYDYGVADFDLKHNFVLNGTFAPTWKRNNIFLGGWSISPIITLHSGTPFSPYDGSSTYNPIADGRPGLNRIVYTGGGSLTNAIANQTGNLYVNGYLKPGVFADYTCPTSQLWCAPPIERNSFYGPRFANVDIGISKVIKLYERSNLTLGINGFNAFNHVNWANPDVNLNDGSNFGHSFGTGSARVIQMSGRIDF